MEVGKLKLRGKAELPRRVETVDAARRGRLVEGPELVIVELRGDQRSSLAISQLSSPPEWPVGVRVYDELVGEGGPVTGARDVYVVHVGCRDILANLGDQVQNKLHVVRLAPLLGDSE